MPTVAIADDFLDAFARIPRAQQKKVRDFTAKFKADPKSTAINYEKLHGSPDDKSAPCGSTRSTGPSCSTPTRATCTSSSGWTTTTRRWTGRSGGPSRSTPAPGPCRSSTWRRSRRPSPPMPGARTGRGCWSGRATTTCSPSASPRSCSPPCGRSGRPRGCSRLGKHLPCRSRRGPRLAGRGRLPRECGHGGDGRSSGDGRPRRRAARPAADRRRSDRGHVGPRCGPRAPRLPPPLRHDPERRGTDLDPRRPAGEVAGLPPPQPGASSSPSPSTARPESPAGRGPARRSWRCTGLGIWPGPSARRRRTRSCSRPTRRTSPRTSARASPTSAAPRRTGSRSSTCTPGPHGSCGTRAGSSRSPARPNSTPAGRRRSGGRASGSSTPASWRRSGIRSSRPTRSRPPPTT